TANYSMDVVGGTASIGMSYTRILEQGIIPLQGEPVNNLGGEVGYPNNKGFVTVGYDTGPFSLTATGTYIGKTYLDDIWIESNFGTNVNMDDFKVSPIFYTDLQLKYTVADTYDLYVGVNNLFDTAPPPIWSGLPGGTSSYDQIGRRFYFGVRATF
ncbi:MAG: TonB-dependent receptor, partial [Oricola sp.]|nr:TonB-dependent receptor [Oricola sp.]